MSETTLEAEQGLATQLNFKPMSENTFTVYLLTLTESGFKEETIHGCFYPEFDGRIELPNGSFLYKDGLDKASINDYRSHSYYSLDPDFEIGKRALLAKSIENRDKAQATIDQIEKLLNP